MKKAEDIVWAQRASDEARERNIRLAHQSHTGSLFETVSGSIDVPQAGWQGRTSVSSMNLRISTFVVQDYGVETLKQFSPYLFNVYLQNHIQSPDGDSRLTTWIRGVVAYTQIRLQDAGGIDFKAVFQGLSEIGYDGYVTVHQCVCDDNDTGRRGAPELRLFDADSGF